MHAVHEQPFQLALSNYMIWAFGIMTKKFTMNYKRNTIGGYQILKTIAYRNSSVIKHVRSAEGEEYAMKIVELEP